MEEAIDVGAQVMQAGIPATTPKDIQGPNKSTGLQWRIFI